MHRIITGAVCALGMGLSASPAWANGSFVLPEPNPVTLISLGMAGLIIGRRLAFKKPPRD